MGRFGEGGVGGRERGGGERGREEVARPILVTFSQSLNMLLIP